MVNTKFFDPHESHMSPTSRPVVPSSSWKLPAAEVVVDQLHALEHRKLLVEALEGPKSADLIRRGISTSPEHLCLQNQILEESAWIAFNQYSIAACSSKAKIDI